VLLHISSLDFTLRFFDICFRPQVVGSFNCLFFSFFFSPTVKVILECCPEHPTSSSATPPSCQAFLRFHPAPIFTRVAGPRWPSLTCFPGWPLWKAPPPPRLPPTIRYLKKAGLPASQPSGASSLVCSLPPSPINLFPPFDLVLRDTFHHPPCTGFLRLRV